MAVLGLIHRERQLHRIHRPPSGGSTSAESTATGPGPHPATHVASATAHIHPNRPTIRIGVWGSAHRAACGDSCGGGFLRPLDSPPKLGLEGIWTGRRDRRLCPTRPSALAAFSAAGVPPAAVKPVEVVLSHDVARRGRPRVRLPPRRQTHEGHRASPALVHGHDFPDVFQLDGHRRGPGFVEVLEPHLAPEDVGLEMTGLALAGEQLCTRRRELRHRFLVLVELEIQAFELAALARQFLGVERQLLVTRRSGGHAAEIGQPRGATQLSSATSDAAQSGEFLTRTNLPHLDLDVERRGQCAHQFESPPAAPPCSRRCTWCRRLNSTSPSFISRWCSAMILRASKRVPSSRSRAACHVVMSSMVALRTTRLISWVSLTPLFFIWARTNSPVRDTMPMSSPGFASTTATSPVCTRRPWPIRK